MFLNELIEWMNEWMNEWAFTVTYTEVQAKLQQSTRPYINDVRWDASWVFLYKRMLNILVQVFILYKA